MKLCLPNFIYCNSCIRKNREEKRKLQEEEQRKSQEEQIVKDNSIASKNA